MTKWRSLLFLPLALFLLSMACSLPGQGDPVATATSLPPTSLLPTATQPAESPDDNQPTETTQPTVTVTAAEPSVGPVAAPNMTCGSVSFYLAPSLASGGTCTTAPASSNDANAAGWEVYPAHTEVALEGYALQNTFHQPRVYIYPIAEYEAMGENAGQVIARLRQLLLEQPAAPESIPFLPPFNAAQMLRSKVLYVDFQSGSGVRFLTQYGQAAYPVNNEMLFYTFQGLTTDGRFYVSAIFPVSHPDLPSNGTEVPNGDWNAFASGFESYLLDTQAALDSWLNGSFHPHLELLDMLIQSLKVE